MRTLLNHTRHPSVRKSRRGSKRVPSRRTRNNVRVRVRPRKLKSLESEVTRRRNESRRSSISFGRIARRAKFVFQTRVFLYATRASRRLFLLIPRAITSSNSVAHVITTEYRAHSRPIRCDRRFRRFILSRKTMRSVSFRTGPNIVFSILLIRINVK